MSPAATAVAPYTAGFKAVVLALYVLSRRDVGLLCDSGAAVSTFASARSVPSAVVVVDLAATEKLSTRHVS